MHKINADASRSVSWIFVALVALTIHASLASTLKATYLTGTGGVQSNIVFALGSTINFDSGPVGNASSVTLGNVKFIGVDGQFMIDPAYIGQYNTQGVNSLQTGNVMPPFFPSVWQFNFTIPVNAFGFDFGASDNTWQLSAYDSGNNLLETDFTTPTGGSNAGEYFGIQAAGIAKVIMTDQLDFYPTGDQVFIDNFTSTFEIVPEPSTWALCLIGTGALALVARRKSRSRR